MFESVFHCARACKDYLRKVGWWQESVRAGRVFFDPAHERQYREEGGLLLSVATYHLAGGSPLLADLTSLLSSWQTPRRGGPAQDARRPHPIPNHGTYRNN